MSTSPGIASPVFISAAALLDHWQGHRRLTRRVYLRALGIEPPPFYERG
jgi:hypothetical protein